VDRVPPSNPNYNAKYVKVYDSTEDTVTVGYTPGYTGSYVDNGTVVYGTGYDYSGYSSPEAYIPPPATYGYAAATIPTLFLGLLNALLSTRLMAGAGRRPRRWAWGWRPSPTTGGAMVPVTGAAVGTGEPVVIIMSTSTISTIM
jgi:hypothetical protein